VIIDIVPLEPSASPPVIPGLTRNPGLFKGVGVPPPVIPTKPVLDYDLGAEIQQTTGPSGVSRFFLASN
jgi:hypothetical protein